jgi:hypothetical protein
VNDPSAGPSDTPPVELGLVPRPPAITIRPLPVAVTALRLLSRGPPATGRLRAGPSASPLPNAAIPRPGPAGVLAGAQSASSPLQRIAPGPPLWNGSAAGKTTRGAATDAHLTTEIADDHAGWAHDAAGELSRPPIAAAMTPSAIRPSRPTRRRERPTAFDLNKESFPGGPPARA